MCVQTQNLPWERPAVARDVAVIESHFPECSLEGALEAMSENGFQPLTADLVLLAAMLATKADAGGMRYVPFSGLDSKTADIVKLPVMDQIDEWYENTALGTDMWKQASDWTENACGGRVHFAMNCGCGIVDVRAYKTGAWASWMKAFNASRHDVVGRTNVVRRPANEIAQSDLTAAQLFMWQRMRTCLESLPALEINAFSEVA